jgi:hypothetical protein
MKKIEDDKVIKIDPNSSLAQGLYKMAIHKRLRHQFRRGEISLEELNHQLREKGVPRHYEQPTTV